MLGNVLNAWKGSLIINGVEYDSISSIPSNLTLENGGCIILKPSQKSVLNRSTDENTAIVGSGLVRICVRAYMTKKATPEFDFMARWNNDNPMPMRVMVGEVVKETRGMVYMKLHGDITAKVTEHCMKCGKRITNPVSRFFGMGPECGQHNYVNPFETDEELQKAVDAYRTKLQEITWEGWIIKSAIEEREVL